MSRFFRAGESDSDETDSDFSDELTHSESEGDSDSDSDDSSSDDNDATKTTGGRSRRIFEGSDSDSEDDTVRVVRSAKDKRFEEIEQAVTSMINGQKINDWVSAQNGKFLLKSKQNTSAGQGGDEDSGPLNRAAHCRINRWIVWIRIRKKVDPNRNLNT